MDHNPESLRGAPSRSALDSEGKLNIPTLCVAGAMSGLGAVMDDMVAEIATQVRSAVAPRSGHWVPEENPPADAQR